VHAGTFHLYPGWIPGFRNDLSDIQWRTYRSSLPQLVATLSVYTLVSRALRSRPSDTSSCHFSAIHNAYCLAASVAFLLILHGSYALHVILAVCLHHTLVTAVAGTPFVGPLIVWSFPSAVWFAGRLLDGMAWRAVFPALAFLDVWSGPVRWQITFNLLLLRMVSWGMDLHWTRSRQRGLLSLQGFVPRFLPLQRIVRRALCCITRK
jgi:protein-cysteine N-palmitoyltransferase HHAT